MLVEIGLFVLVGYVLFVEDYVVDLWCDECCVECGGWCIGGVQVLYLIVVECDFGCCDVVFQLGQCVCID